MKAATLPKQPLEKTLDRLTAAYQERAPFFRITVSMPPSLALFIASQAKLFPDAQGAANASAYFRDLVQKHQDTFTKRKGKGAGSSVNKLR